MGHDITAYIPGTKEKIIHLRIGGLYRRGTHFYRSLGANQFNNQDSGNGDKATFTLEQITKAERCSEITQAEHLFLVKCRAHCSRDGIEIQFA